MPFHVMSPHSENRIEGIAQMALSSVGRWLFARMAELPSIQGHALLMQVTLSTKLKQLKYLKSNETTADYVRQVAFHPATQCDMQLTSLNSPYKS